MKFPIDDVIPDLKAALATRPSAILVAEPGAGKTTRVPLALLAVDSPIIFPVISGASFIVLRTWPK